MTVRFLVPAAVELDEAIAFYDAQQRGLGGRFVTTVQDTLARVVRFPEGYQRIGKYSRRSIVSAFPYGVIYQLRPDASHILVVAVAHLHRRPDYWQSRDAA